MSIRGELREVAWLAREPFFSSAFAGRFPKLAIDPVLEPEKQPVDGKRRSKLGAAEGGGTRRCRGRPSRRRRGIGRVLSFGRSFHPPVSPTSSVRALIHIGKFSRPGHIHPQGLTRASCSCWGKIPANSPRNGSPIICRLRLHGLIERIPKTHRFKASRRDCGRW
jgi:hypothetical protein